MTNKNLKKIKKFEYSEEVVKNFEIFKKINFDLKDDTFFFYLPSDFSVLPNKLYEDFKKDELVRDLLISIMEWYRVPLVFYNIKDYGDDLDLYLTFFIILEVSSNGEIREYEIQDNCFNDISKIDLLIKILFFLSKLDKIYRALDDYGLLERYLIV